MTSTTLTDHGLADRQLGWAKPERKFRLRWPGHEMLVSTLEGSVLFTAMDGIGGHINMLSDLAVDEAENGALRLPQISCYTDDVPVATQYTEWWQCCFQRKDNVFRLWERGKRDTMVYVYDVRGPAYIEWKDRGGHIYVHGRLWLTDQRADGAWRANFAGDVPRGR